jgi:hypothetical protein
LYAVIDQILEEAEIQKFITMHSIKEHPKVSEIAKFGCEMWKIYPCEVCITHPQPAWERACSVI